MGSKPRQKEYVSKLLADKDRAIYWLCALLERDSQRVRDGARRALADLGYDERRIEGMLLLGEPYPSRAGEERHAMAYRYDGVVRTRDSSGCREPRPP